MISRLRRQPIKNKLTIYSMLITGVALLLACLAFSIYDWMSVRQKMVDEMEVLAEIIGKNCTAALSFSNQEDAKEILSAVNVNEHVMWAAVFDSSDNRFAVYERNGHAFEEELSLPPEETHLFREGRLIVRKQINMGYEAIGTVYVVSDLGELHARIQTFVVILIAVLVMSSLAAFLIARKLQRGISDPILQLANTAKTVSETKEYSVRATKYNDDELGFLTERFNEMLAQIQERNNALQSAHDKLEKQARRLCDELRQRKRLQSELARAQRLETAGRIAGQIAHDFNNLLGPLAAYPALIREDLPPHHSALEMLSEMETSAAKIAEINQQLLALGRRGHYTQEAVDLNDLVQKVLQSIKIPGGMQVHRRLAPDLCKIKGGGAQLTRALSNILINAIEAMPSDGVLTIRTENVRRDRAVQKGSSVTSGEYVKIEISDTGQGIERRYLDKIFDPFFTTKKMDRMRGSGLGLSVVHGIVEDHEGYVSVESALGEGTTFSLLFPVNKEEEDETSDTVEEIRGGEESILVVDDDPVQRRVARTILHRLGYEVHAIASGEQAIQYVREHPPDLIVLDMLMEGMDGTATYQEILRFRPEQRALVLSGYAVSKRVDKALELGAGFIAKPISRMSLAHAVRKELDRQPNHSEA